MTQEQLENLNQLFADNKNEEVISIVEESEVQPEERSLQSKLALAYYHTEHYDKSTALFEQLAQNSTDSLDWFNLSTSLIRNKDVLNATNALNTAIKYNRETETNGKGMPTAFMRLYAAQAFAHTGNYTLAYNQLVELAEFYREVSKTDDNTLYSKGIPFFSEFTSLAKTILANQKVTDGRNWLNYIGSGLDENGKKALDEIGKELSI